MSRYSYHRLSDFFFLGVGWLLFILLIGVIVSGSWTLLSQHFSAERLMIWLHAHRYTLSTILLIGLSLVLLAKKRASRSEDPFGSDNFYESEDEHFDEPMTDVEYVLSQEFFRRESGYKPGWLYFRCKELGLLGVYESLVAEGLIERPESRRNSTESRGHKKEEEVAEQPKSSIDPFEILGVSRSASEAEIKAAYRKLMNLNHPDRVHGLDPKIQELAKKRSTEINFAYEQLRKRKE